MDTTGVTSSTGQIGQAGFEHWSHRHHGHRSGNGAPGSNSVSGGQEDRFTRSGSQGKGSSAADAGLFTVNSVQFFSESATFVSVQTPAAQGNPPAASTSSASPTGSTDSSFPTSATSSETSPATTAVTPTAADTSAQSLSNLASIAPTTSAGLTTRSADTQGSSALQALNSSLASLGLNQQEIQAFDQVATFIQSISPAAFNDLVNQLGALAQHFTQTAAASSAKSDAQPVVTADSQATSTSSGNGASNASASTAASPDPNAVATSSATPSASPAATGTVQVQELSVQFSEVQVEGNYSGPANGTQASAGNSGSSAQPTNTAGSSFEFVAFKLQIEEITATLPGNGGQVTSAQTPSQTANAGSSDASQSAPTSQAAVAA